MSELWFPSVDAGNVVGRVTEVEKEHPAMSRAEGKSVKVMVPVMMAKVAGSADVSTQEIKEHNRVQVTSRFPGAWDHFVKLRGEVPAGPVVSITSGTPIGPDIVPREKIEWLKQQGFTSVEQLAQMDDHAIQNLGTGARQWRKKAVNQLSKKA